MTKRKKNDGEIRLYKEWKFFFNQTPSVTRIEKKIVQNPFKVLKEDIQGVSKTIDWI